MICYFIVYELESMNCTIGCYTWYWYYENFLLGWWNMYEVWV